MIIDSHSHVIIPNNKHIEIMKDANVDMTILFSTLIHPEKSESYNEFIEEMGMLQKILNNQINGKEARERSLQELVDTVNRFPERFIGFGPVPVGMSAQDTGEWIESKIVKNNLKGLGEFTLGPNSIKLLQPIFESANELNGLPIWIHTFSPLGINDIKELVELTKQFSKVPVVFGHLGGLNWLETIQMVKDIPNGYLDISAFYTTFALSLAMKEVPDRTMFSSDYPYGDPYLAIEAVKRYAPSKDIERRVLGETIADLLNITVPSPS
ncbi:amidohydrolase family protein [Bacillus gobiensis]|uniref:amidohydrolase family protein n=1 Tax=Bacillus gobiensis TaxID=1441095 RepID=UPI003D1FF83E